VLQTEGHPKWRDVRLSLPSLAKGWTYYAPTARVLGTCGNNESASAAPLVPAPAGPKKACTQQEKILGLCAAP
jgi:hypothetical protein